MFRRDILSTSSGVEEHAKQINQKQAAVELHGATSSHCEKRKSSEEIFLFMESEISFPRSQKPTAYPWLESAEFIPCIRNTFLLRSLRSMFVSELVSYLQDIEPKFCLCFCVTSLLYIQACD